MKRNVKRMLAMLLAMVLVIGIAPADLVVSAEEANTYYVATTGNDETGDGTQANPYASIQKAVNVIPAKNTVPTTILVAEGAYDVFVPHGSANDLYATATQTARQYGHNLFINKDNLTIQPVSGAKVILYSYVEDAYVDGIFLNVPTVRISGGKNVTLDGLTILPAMRGTSAGNFSQEISANDLREFVGAAAEDTDKTVYVPKYTTFDNSGVIAMSNHIGVSDARNITIKNSVVGYTADGLTNQVAFYYNGSTLYEDYHILNNKIQGRIRLLNTGRNATVASEIIGNECTDFRIDLTASYEAGLPIIRDNVIHSANADGNGTYLTQPSVLYIASSSTYRYTLGEMSAIAMSTTRTDGSAHGVAHAVGSTNHYYIVLSTGNTKPDTTVDTEEEFGYLLGKEGTIDLAASIVITKEGVLPEEGLATVNFGNYTVTKTADLELPAPKGYEWDGDTLVKKAAWISTALLLKNDLNMKFYVAADRVASGEKLVVTMNGNEVTLSDWQDGTGANAGKKFVTFEGIAATRMAETVSVQLVDAEGNPIADCNHVDSIRMYAERLKAAYNDNDGYKNLVNALLAYGAAAQYVENANVAEEDLANYGWSWE